jgi:hypothetical protein
MPFNCPRFYPEYNACLGCRNRHDNDCWANLPITQKLSDILTIEERVGILEDRKEIPAVNVVTITKQDYQQLQRLLLSLQEKVDGLSTTKHRITSGKI